MQILPCSLNVTNGSSQMRQLHGDLLIIIFSTQIVFHWKIIVLIKRLHIRIKMSTLLNKWASFWNYYSVVSTLIISKQTELNLLQNPLFYILIWTKETFWTFVFSSCEYDFICLNIFFIGASLTFYSSLPFYESTVKPYVRMTFAYNNLSLTQCYIMCVFGYAYQMHWLLTPKPLYWIRLALNCWKNLSSSISVLRMRRTKYWWPTHGYSW